MTVGLTGCRLTEVPFAGTHFVIPTRPGTVLPVYQRTRTYDRGRTNGSGVNKVAAVRDREHSRVPTPTPAVSPPCKNGNMDSWGHV